MRGTKNIFGFENIFDIGFEHVFVQVSLKYCDWPGGNIAPNVLRPACARHKKRVDLRMR